jgi:predicted amidophosphoribosyltransferase
MFVARRLREELDNEAIAIASMFDGSWMAVPVPRSSPTKDGALWPAERIAAALLRAGLVRSTQPILRRAEAVAKSATAESKDRPSAAKHYSSMKVTLDANSDVRSESPLGELIRAELGPRPKLLLVDDVITRGATMLAASSVLLDEIPDANVVAFAVVRTNSDLPEPSLLSPRRGWVRLRGEATFRRP